MLYIWIKILIWWIERESVFYGNSLTIIFSTNNKKIKFTTNNVLNIWILTKMFIFCLIPIILSILIPQNNDETNIIHENNCWQVSMTRVRIDFFCLCCFVKWLIHDYCHHHRFPYIWMFSHPTHVSVYFQIFWFASSFLLLLFIEFLFTNAINLLFITLIASIKRSSFIFIFDRKVSSITFFYISKILYTITIFNHFAINQRRTKKCTHMNILYMKKKTQWYHPHTYQ